MQDADSDEAVDVALVDLALDRQSSRRQAFSSRIITGRLADLPLVVTLEDIAANHAFRLEPRGRG
jgi:hypothetical protein